MVAIKVYKPYEQRPAQDGKVKKSKYIFAPAKRTIHPRLRHYQPSYVPMTAAQRNERKNRCDKRRDELKKDMQALNAEFELRCATLSQKYGRKERYFKDMFFQGGTRVLRQQKKVNRYNAWKYVKSHDLRESLNTVQIAKQYGDEYHTLCKKENRHLMHQIIKRYKRLTKGATYKRLKLPTAKRRAQIFAKGTSNMAEIFDSLK
ncbi:hypothetical protein MPER_02933, partial [Moniliophthora perniciosa FA553]